MPLPKLTPKTAVITAAVFVLVACLGAMVWHSDAAQAPVAPRAFRAINRIGLRRHQPAPPKPTPSSTATTPAGLIGPKHEHIVTTVFWVGEQGDADNSNIPNHASTWDEHWQQHYGGVDTPTARKGLLPAGFVPKENPFYFALPYSDLTENGKRKATASKCPNANLPAARNYSWCKNSWIQITYQGKTAYAQWEDAGPYGEDDVAYVFGAAAPKNHIDTKAGLDVSPAVRDHLGFHDDAVTVDSWAFVAANSVPDGPWRITITTTPSFSVE